MTSTEGAALSHLRDIYYILTHDFASTDLHALSQVFQALDPAAYPDTASSVAATAEQKLAEIQVAQSVSPIVFRLAPTVVLFSTAVEAADKHTTRGVFGTKCMIAMVWIMLVGVVFGAGALIGYILYKGFHERHMDIELLLPTFGKILLVMLAGIAFLVAWLMMLNARKDQMNHNRDVLKVGYWHVHNVVGGTYAMRFSAAMQHGTLQAFINNPSFSNSSGSLHPATDCETEDTTPDDAEYNCNRQITGCGAKSNVTLPTLDNVIANSCPNEIYLMLDMLQLIKTEGIDKYDRTTMWSSISVGIDAIRKSIAVSANADTSPTSAPGTDVTVVTDAVPATAAFAGVAATADTTGMAAVAAKPATAKSSVTALPATLAAKVVASFLPILETADVLAQATNLSTTLHSVDPDVTQTTDTEKARKALKPALDAMTSQILQIIQALSYKLNIRDYRDTLVASMSTYYGTAYPSIRFELLSVLAQVQKALDAAPPASGVRSIYVDAPTMVARVAAMGPSAWQDLISGADVTRQTVSWFLTNFKLPAKQPDQNVDIAKMVMIILTLAGFITLLMYLATVWYEMEKLKLDGQTAARFVLVACCVYALAVVISFAMVDRMGFRVDHNWAALVHNGQTLNYSLGTTESAGLAIENAKDSITAAQAQTYIDAATTAVEAYDDCNAITNGVSVVPFPMMELVIYATVVVVVFAGVIYSINELDPSEKLSSIRTLMRLRERVEDGDMPGGLERQLECCSPQLSVWQVLMWLSVLVLFCLNIYVMVSVQSTNGSYQRSLLLQDNCVT